MADRMAGKTQELKGRAKQAAGKATGDRTLEVRGKADELKGQTKQAGAAVKRAARKATKTVSR